MCGSCEAGKEIGWQAWAGAHGKGGSQMLKLQPLLWKPVVSHQQAPEGLLKPRLLGPSPESESLSSLGSEI